MRQKLATTLAALFVIAAGLYGAPAQAGPSVSLAFSGFLGLAPNGGLTFNNAVDAANDTGVGITQEIADAMDGFIGQGGYGAILGLHYDITVDDPSPSTPREWLLGLDLHIDGGFLTPGNPDSVLTTFDETDLGPPSPLSGIPITDLTGPFSVDDLAMLGNLILNELLQPCAGPPANALPAGLGACLYAADPGFLSGDIFLGIAPEATDELPLGLLGLPEDLILLAAQFDGEVTLTTAAVSEPGSFAVLGLGLVALGIARRRRVR